MPKLLEIDPGTQFGRLTYIREAKRKTLPSGQRPRVGRCRCKCGRIKNVLLLHLTRGRISSCGKCDRQTREGVVGHTFGSLTVTKELKDLIRNGRVFRVVEARCACGKIIIKRLNGLRKLKSCGCLTADILRNKGLTHGMTGTRPYRIWQNMLNRCYNENVPNFKIYGAKGISVCPEWISSFESFYDWAIKNGYSDALTLDRWPNKRGNYTPENCRWATYRQQANNKTTNVYYLYRGESKTLAELAEKYKINYARANARIHKLGWTIEQAIENDYVDPKISISRAHKSRWQKYYTEKTNDT